MTGLVVSTFALPLDPPLRTAQGEVRTRRGFLVRVSGAYGDVGVGEAAPLPPWTEDLKICGTALKEAAECAAQDLADAEEAWARLEVAMPRVGRDAPAARHALACAFLDLAAQQAGVPMAALLARDHGLPFSPPAVVPVNAVVGALPAEQAASQARAAVQAGHATVKVKLTGDAKEDLARAEAVRHAIGPEAELRLDANGAWPNAQEAEARLRELAAMRPRFVEQPVPASDLEGLGALRDAGLVAVAADEAAASMAQARAVLEQAACDVLVVKPTALGGPDHAAEVLALAATRGVACVVTNLLDGPVAREAALHVAALLPEPRMACGLAAVAGMRGPDARMRDGTLALRDAPGLGLRMG